MTPDRLRGWLQRQRVGAAALRLRHDQMGEGTVFQRWPVDSLPEDPHDLVQLIFDCSADYADGVEEAVRVAIEFLSDDGDVLAMAVHKARPEKAASVDAANAANVSEGTIIHALLRHIEVQQRVMSGSNVGAFQTLERALALQNKLLERQATQIAQLADQVLALRTQQLESAGAEDVAVTEEESRARAKAMDRFAELLPHVANAALTFAHSKMNGAAAGAAAPHVAGEVV